MKKNSLVSVVIPFYNYAEWLDEALESVINQTYNNLEIIVINDGSKEDISNLKHKYKDKVMFIDKENGGAASARNIGIKKCHGEYVAFLDSDDKWAKDKIERQLISLQKSGKKWGVSTYKTFGRKKDKIVIPDIGKNVKEILYNSCKIQTSTVIVEKRILIENQLFFAEDMRKGQDVYLWLKLINLFEYDYITETLTFFRIRKNNSCSSAANHIKTRGMLFEKMKDLDDSLIMPQRKLTLVAYKICYFYYYNLKRLLKNDSKILKLFYLIPWLLFRLDNFILKRK